MDNRGKYCVNIAFEQIFFIPRLVGTFPLDHKYELSWKVLIFIIDFIFNSLMALHEFWMARTPFHGYLALLRWGFLLPASFINFVCVYFKVEQLMDFFKELHAFEQYLYRIGVTWNYQYKWWNKYLSMLVAVNSISGWFYDFNLKAFILVTIRRIHVYIVFYTIIDQVTGTTSLLASAFGHLKNIRVDRELLKKFEQLIVLSRSVEDYFGPQILAITAWSFVSSVTVTYWFVISGLNVFQAACLCFLTAYPLVVIYIPFLSIVSQARKINKLLYRRLLANPNDIMLEFHMIAKKSVTFTAYGFFRINSSLVGSMIGAGTTYLVILLQYGK
ncbi:Gustatory receptor 110 [Halyomorpha halys]|nr:Gustatory receptor 110 [Halyomorpha halys]